MTDFFQQACLEQRQRIQSQPNDATTFPATEGSQVGEEGETSPSAQQHGGITDEATDKMGASG